MESLGIFQPCYHVLALEFRTWIHTFIYIVQVYFLCHKINLLMLTKLSSTFLEFSVRRFNTLQKDLYAIIISNSISFIVFCCKKVDVSIMDSSWMNDRLVLLLKSSSCTIGMELMEGLKQSDWSLVSSSSMKVLLLEESLKFNQESWIIRKSTLDFACLRDWKTLLKNYNINWDDI